MVRCYPDIVAVIEQIMSRREAFDHHGPRVSVLAMDFAQKAGLSVHEIEMMGFSGSLHDIGKLFTDDKILNAPRRLTPSEYAKIMVHPREGWLMLEALNYDPIILDVVLHHHENWDGSGFPDGLTGEQISMHARMMRIVDVYDALTHVRPQRPAKRHEYAMAEMNEFSGRWFDPHLLEMFFYRVATHG